MADMQQSHLLLLLLPIFLLATARVAAGGGRASFVIRSTCAAVNRSELATPYAYCLQTLSANPAAASARDARGLAVAAAELTVANVTRTIDALSELIGGLQGCVNTYQAMRGAVAGALDDLRAGRLGPAWPNLRAASLQPDYCDLDLMQIRGKDPIYDENLANLFLSRLASNIAGLIAAAAAAAPAPPPLPESR